MKFNALFDVGCRTDIKSIHRYGVDEVTVVKHKKSFPKEANVGPEGHDPPTP